jgi:hypothetical protein
VTVLPGVDPARAGAVDAKWTTEAMRAVGDGLHPVPGRRSSVGDRLGGEWRAGTKTARTVGRLFLSYGGKNHSCTATHVRVSGSRMGIVATAGHCVVLQRGDHAVPKGDLYFVPGYRDGQAPYGGFSVRRISVPSGWTGPDQPGDILIGSDQAFLTLNPNAAGKTIAQATGSAGQQMTLNGARLGERAYLFGYAAESAKHAYENTPAFTGNRLAACWGPLQLWAGHANGDLTGLACGAGAGSSGGPRFVRFDPRSGRGLLVGINNAGGRAVLPPAKRGGAKRGAPGLFGVSFSKTVTGPLLAAATKP